MKVTKVRRKSSYPMGTTKCMRVRRTSGIHIWGRIGGHVDDQCGKLIRCMRGTSIIEGGDSNREVGDCSGKRSGRESIEGIRETGT